MRTFSGQTICCSSSRVPSVEQSSTMMISLGKGCSNTRRTTSRRDLRSLYTGISTEIARICLGVCGVENGPKKRMGGVSSGNMGDWPDCPIGAYVGPTPCAPHSDASPLWVSPMFSLCSSWFMGPTATFPISRPQDQIRLHVWPIVMQSQCYPFTLTHISLLPQRIIAYPVSSGLRCDIMRETNVPVFTSAYNCDAFHILLREWRAMLRI